MRTRVICVHLVALAAFALLVSAAAAAPAHRHLPATTTQATTKPVPAWVIAPKTAAMLGGSTYPWVEPAWTSTGGAVLPTVPRAVQVENTQPPARVPTG